MAVERENLDWGVRLTTQPFTGANASLTIKAEIAPWRPTIGSPVRITFTGTSASSPLRLLDAQAWNEAMTALITETRKVIAELKAEAPKAPPKKKR